jgi:hypothetical protein
MPKLSILVPINKGTPLYKKLRENNAPFTISKIVGFSRADNWGDGKAIRLKKIPVNKKTSIRPPKNRDSANVIGGNNSDQPNEYKKRHQNHDIANAIYGLATFFRFNFIFAGMFIAGQGAFLHHQF